METLPQTCTCDRNHKYPSFDPVDSTPISEESETYHLKLCFCPLCQKGMEVLFKEKSRNVVSWQYLCRVIFYCLKQLNKDKEFFTLKYDVHWFIVDHWYLFGQLDQFKTNPNKWKKAILDAMIHCNLFESGKSVMKKTGVWKLKSIEVPWEDDQSTCEDTSKNAECNYELTNRSSENNEKCCALPSLSAIHSYNNDIERMLLPSLYIPTMPNYFDDLDNEDGFVQNIM